MEQGEVWWVRLEGEAGLRPGVILTRSWIIPKLTHITVAQMSRTIRTIPTHVRLTAIDDGVQFDSTVNLDNIQTISCSQFIQKMVRLRHERVEEVFAAVRAAFEMPR